MAPTPTKPPVEVLSNSKPQSHLTLKSDSCAWLLSQFEFNFHLNKAELIFFGDCFADWYHKRYCKVDTLTLWVMKVIFLLNQWSTGKCTAICTTVGQRAREKPNATTSPTERLWHRLLIFWGTNSSWRPQVLFLEVPHQKASGHQFFDRDGDHHPAYELFMFAHHCPRISTFSCW